MASVRCCRGAESVSASVLEERTKHTQSATAPEAKCEERHQAHSCCCALVQDYFGSRSLLPSLVHLGRTPPALRNNAFHVTLRGQVKSGCTRAWPAARDLWAFARAEPTRRQNSQHIHASALRIAGRGWGPERR